MAAEAILSALVRVNVIASAAILLVMLLRPHALRWLGARVAYWLWLVVPIAVAVGVLPARERIVVVAPLTIVAAAQEPSDDVLTEVSALTETSTAVAAASFVSQQTLADVLVALWLFGAGALLARSIVTTRRLAADPSVGPALVGVLKPKLVLPADFESRFDAQERVLILAHETVHRVSGHTAINGLVELARCASWFNPLVHVAALRIRADQELACDAAVIAARPTERRAYAQALLKTQIAPAFVRFGCTWTSPSAKRIGERIELLNRASLSRRATFAGASTVAVVGLALGYAAWAQQPERVVTQTARPQAVWTATADAPPGSMSHALEGQRHDRFIELARKGGIDLVFFGTTETEMWWWNGRGRAVWDREYAWRRAQNFGSQGTNPKSLLWRMRNGELDGYDAKLVVIQLALAPGGRIHDPSAPTGEPEFLAAWSAIVAEIHARQPQAKILFVAPVPRGIRWMATRTEWREVADANAAVVQKLTDGESVFYADFGERFFLPDGSYNRDYWATPGRVGVGGGMQPPAYEVLAEELKPWVMRFVG